MMIKQYSQIAVGFAFLLALAGCMQSGTSRVTISIPRALVTDFGLNGIFLDITGPDMEPILQDLDEGEIMDPVVFNVDVPVGPDRTFRVRALQTLVPNFQGFEGVETVDVTEGEQDLPITMNFVNFVLDAINTDVLVDDNQNPDFSAIRVLFGTGNDLGFPICPLVDSIFFHIVIQPYDVAGVDFLNMIIEFDVDDDPDTGSARTIIQENIDLGAPIPNVFTQGSERMVLLEVNNADQFTQIDLFDVSGGGLPQLLFEDTSEIFNANWNPGKAEMIFCMSLELFRGQDGGNPGVDVDVVDGRGTFNILTGSVLGNFIANDMASATTKIYYDLDFDTSGP